MTLFFLRKKTKSYYAFHLYFMFGCKMGSNYIKILNFGFNGKKHYECIQNYSILIKKVKIAQYDFDMYTNFVIYHKKWLVYKSYIEL